MEELPPTIAPPTELALVQDKAVDIDWSLTTWKGSRREQHQAYLTLPFSRKLELNEAMCDQARLIAEHRREQGLPFFDPYTGRVVRPASVEGAAVEDH